MLLFVIFKFKFATGRRHPQLSHPTGNLGVGDCRAGLARRKVGRDQTLPDHARIRQAAHGTWPSDVCRHRAGQKIIADLQRVSETFGTKIGFVDGVGIVKLPTDTTY